MVKQYTNIALPYDLIERINQIVNKAGMGYKSRGEFVKEAVRNLLNDLSKFERLPKFKK